MWPYICFTVTGPFYRIHDVQPQCPLLIQANPALSWRAALTSVPSAFPAQPWTALGPLDTAWSSQEVRLGVQSHQSPSLPGGCWEPWACSAPSVGAGCSSCRRWGAWSASTDSQELMCPDRQSPGLQRCLPGQILTSTCLGECRLRCLLHPCVPAQPNPRPNQSSCLFPDCSSSCKLEMHSLGAGGARGGGIFVCFLRFLHTCAVRRCLLASGPRVLSWGAVHT